jgi:hypothetical protein
LAGQAVPQNNIQIFLNVNLNSRLLAGTLSEALLIVDEPDNSQQRTCTPGPCPITGQATSTSGSGINYATTAGVPNVFQGTQVAPNSISWLGVPIDPPGPAGVRTIRIANIRGNMYRTAFGFGTQAVMFISVSGNNQVAINNPQQSVAYLQNGLTFQVLTAAGDSTGGVPVALRQCVDNNPAQSTNRYSAADMTQTLTLSFSENFATAFKPRVVTSNGLSTGTIQSQNIPGTSYNTESGFYNSSWTGNLRNAGLADSGTKLIARFNNVPDGVALFVSVAQNSTSAAGATAKLIGTYDTGDSGALPDSLIAVTTAAGGGVAPVMLNNGSGVAVWEIETADPAVVESLHFSLFVAYTANTSAKLPGAGAVTVNGAFAPLSTYTDPSTGPVPRFFDTSVAAASFNIVPCSTNILFPFVTNQNGFDTGVTIANTSVDTAGTAPQAGRCTLNYFGGITGGGHAPVPQKSGVVEAGAVLRFTLSSGGNLGVSANPGFQGYMIVSCDFQYAHGFAYVGDVGQNRVAESYLGLILDQIAVPARYGNQAEIAIH